MRLLLLSMCLLTGPVLFAQRVISGRSGEQQVKIVPSYVFQAPSHLKVNVRLIEANGDGLLEAGEESGLCFEIRNEGKGSAYGLKLQRLEDKRPDISCSACFAGVSEIRPGGDYTVNLPLRTEDVLQTGEAVLRFAIREHFGFDADTCVIQFYTVGRLPMELVCGEIILKQENGLEDKKGCMQAGVLSEVEVECVNLGRSLKNCRYVVRSEDRNLFLADTSGELGNIPIGAKSRLRFRICPNNRAMPGEVLPVGVHIFSEGNERVLLKLPLVVDRRPPGRSVLAVRPELETILKWQAAGWEDDLERLMRIPCSGIERKNAVAIVIGVENYKYLPVAPYASRDAALMAGYLKQTLGVGQVLEFCDNSVRGDFFNQWFGPEGRLARLVKPGITDVYVYYSGHGIPEKDGNDAYLFPVDGKIAEAENCGYSLNRLYAALDNLKARSVTIFMDACFIGVSKYSETYAERNISGTKGVLVRPLRVQPWLENKHFTIFSSSHQDQSSLAFDRSETGLFTYYLALGLHGDADIDGDGKITGGELADYVTRQVVTTSRRIRGEQTPLFCGCREQVIVEFKRKDP